MGVKRKAPKGVIRYRARDIVRCVAVQERIRKVMRHKSLLYPSGVPLAELADWALANEERVKRFLRDHRDPQHRCPPPLVARVIELEHQRRMFA